MKLNRIGTSILVGVLATSILAFSGCSSSKSSSNSSAVEETTENTNQSEADKIIAQINEIGIVTLDSESKIKAARSAFDKAENSVQVLVTNKDKLVKAEDTFYGLKADHVISLIKSIGTVNENSESKIKEAETAYNGLPTEAKEKVTNYTTLTAARSELTSIKKQAVKSKMDTALSNLTKNYDDVTGVTWYYPSVKPYYDDERTYVLPYIGIKGDNNAWLGFVADYTGDDWVFFQKLYINANGERYLRECEYSKITRDHNKGIVWEYFSSQADQTDTEWMEAVANSNDTTIRFSGKYNYDLKVSDSDKQAYKQVLEAYEAITEYVVFDVNEIVNN